jgi:hypothetical protein
MKESFSSTGGNKDKDFFRGSQKPLPEFMKENIPDWEGYPLVDEKIKRVRSKYELYYESPKNRFLHDRPENKDENRLKKQTITKFTNYPWWPGMSFYNATGDMRLSDHWNTGDHDKVDDFIPDVDYAYVGRRVTQGYPQKWSILEKIPLSRSHPVVRAKENVFLEKQEDLILKNYFNIIAEYFNNHGQNLSIPTLKKQDISKEVLKSAQNLYHSLRISGSLRALKLIETNVQKFVIDIKDTIPDEKEKNNLINLIEPLSNIFSSQEYQNDIKKLDSINAEFDRRRYKGYEDDNSVSEYW